MQLSEIQSERLLRDSLNILKAGEDQDKWVFERNRKDVLYFSGGKVEDWAPTTNLEQQQALLDTVSSYTITCTPSNVRYQSDLTSLVLQTPIVVNPHLRGLLCVLFVIAHQNGLKLKEVVKNDGDMLTLFKVIV